MSFILSSALYEGQRNVEHLRQGSVRLVLDRGGRARESPAVEDLLRVLAGPGGEDLGERTREPLADEISAQRVEQLGRSLVGVET